MAALRSPPAHRACLSREAFDSPLVLAARRDPRWAFHPGAFALACTYVYLAPSLPTAENMHKVELQVPLRVYTRAAAA